MADATKKLKKMFQKYQSAKADLEERARALANEATTCGTRSLC